MTRRIPKIEKQTEFHVRLNSSQFHLETVRVGTESPTYLLSTNDYEFEEEWKVYRLDHDEIVVLATLLGKVI